MIGLIILGVIVLYWFLAKTVISKVYVKTQSLTKKRIAIAIFILIPTWDVILGFPIYAYLCMTQSGTKIYKTVDNVEGFYVGKLDSNHPYPPRQGYRYMDYKDEKSGKYYRNAWLNSNTSELCIPVGKYLYSDYAKAFKEGRCIAKEEIAESDVSQWNYQGGVETTVFIPFLGISKSVSQKIIDRKNGELLSEIIEYPWSQGWLIGLINKIIPLVVFHCKRELELNDGYIHTLKPKGEK